MNCAYSLPTDWPTNSPARRCRRPRWSTKRTCASWPCRLEPVLGKAGNNRLELEKALYGTPSDQRPGMLFLFANMPDKDLLTLQADFLLDNVKLAYQARRQVAWGQQIPDAIFFN